MSGFASQVISTWQEVVAEAGRILNRSERLVQLNDEQSDKH